MTESPGGFDRTPPQDMAAEQCVLGGMLLSANVIPDVAEILDPADYYRPIHATIHTAILEQHAAGEPVDAITISARLANAGDLDRVGGAPYLHTLIASVPTAANATYYARIVAEQAGFRGLVETGTAIVQLGHNGGAGRTFAEVADLASERLSTAVAARFEHSTLEPAGALLQPMLDHVEGGQVQGIPTGFIDLDRLLNGLHAGQLIIVAGRPGLGKSTAALDFCRNTSIRAKNASAFFSLEMSKIELMMRVASAEARVALASLRSGQLTDDEWTKIARAMADISDAPLFVDDTPSMNLMEIRSKARKLKQKHGSLKLIVVDYLQLMSSPKKTESRQQEVAELSRGLKLLAKEIEAPVIAVCQLNRGPEQRTDKRPQLSDLRESGSLEQDADVVILLHRDDYYDKESPRAGEADFIVAKHRNGPTDTITVAAQLHLSRFVDMAIG